MKITEDAIEKAIENKDFDFIFHVVKKLQKDNNRLFRANQGMKLSINNAVYFLKQLNLAPDSQAKLALNRLIDLVAD